MKACKSLLFLGFIWIISGMDLIRKAEIIYLEELALRLKTSQFEDTLFECAKK